MTQLVPTLNYSSPNPRNTAFTIRGLGSSVVAISQANDGLEPGVGFYVDQVYHARPATAAFDFTDIEQIEVLRGPQGTLFGKNTTAGAINITTRKPSFTFGGEGEVSVGEQGFWQAKAAVTGPIVSDVVAFRLSGALTRRDGVIFNTVLGRNQNDIHNDAIRGQLLFQPSSDLSIRVIGDWSNFKNECCTQVHVRVAPTLKPVAQQYAALAAGAIPGGYRPPSFNPYDRLTDIDAGLGVDTNEGGVSAIADWKVAMPRSRRSAPGASGTGTRPMTATIPACPSRSPSTSPRGRTSTARSCASPAPRWVRSTMSVGSITSTRRSSAIRSASMTGSPPTGCCPPGARRTCSTAIRPTAPPISAPTATASSPK